MEIVRIGNRWINLGRMDSAGWDDNGTLEAWLSGGTLERFTGDEARELASLLDMASLNATWSTPEAVRAIVADRPVEALDPVAVAIGARHDR